MTAPGSGVRPNPGAVPGFRPRRSAAVVFGTLCAAGVVVGLLWAALAPPVHGVIVLNRSGDRIQGYLGNEADNFFVAAFLMLGMLSVVAVVAAVWAWQWRAYRGPLMVAGLSGGAVAAAAIATGVGAALARLRYGAIDIAAAPVTPENRVHYVTEAPSVFFGHGPLEVVATLLAPAAVAALVYALLAVSTARDDLGGYPPQLQRGADLPQVVTGGAVTTAWQRPAK
ncbi:DUF2567 domain-containing protein [Mycolicibacterium palauense]|uniref:DUF2567 domain-containing protein n=1 Tax=Mycolicibacterium palauense TaxID=2034511 RepID=UPI000BFF0216|nr:DUF2567 domain-containing protein [Mycolicibacterium palauense]